MDLTAETRLDEYQSLKIAIEKHSEDEPNEAYQAFLQYVSFSGPSRTFEKVVAWSGYNAAQIREWARTYEWVKRADGVDAQRWLYEEQKRQEACQADNQEFAENNRKLKKEGQTILSKMLTVSSKLLDAALDANQVKETGWVKTDDGREVPTMTTIEMKAKISDIPRLVATSIQMSRLINDLPTEIVDINRNIVPSNLANFSWEQLEQLEKDNREVLNRVSGAQKLTEVPQ